MATEKETHHAEVSAVDEKERRCRVLAGNCVVYFAHAFCKQSTLSRLEECGNGMDHRHRHRSIRSPCSRCFRPFSMGTVPSVLLVYLPAPQGQGHRSRKSDLYYQRTTRTHSPVWRFYGWGYSDRLRFAFRYYRNYRNLHRTSGQIRERSSLQKMPCASSTTTARLKTLPPYDGHASNFLTDVAGKISTRVTPHSPRRVEILFLATGCWDFGEWGPPLNPLPKPSRQPLFFWAWLCLDSLK